MHIYHLYYLQLKNPKCEISGGKLITCLLGNGYNSLGIKFLVNVKLGQRGRNKKVLLSVCYSYMYIMEGSMVYILQ